VSERIEGGMPDDLVRHLAGGRIVVVATVDEDGAPYTMIMNWAVAKDPRTLRLSIDRRTQTLRNLRANPRVMVEVLGDGLVYGVRGAARIIQEEMRYAPVPSAMVEVDVDFVKRDLIPGVEFRGPSFEWGALSPVMVPADERGIRELHEFGR
jgi:predicted pyridoxine 5'-phosphate oxidase superfamily flavin-nucleotide-binding protein